MLVHWTREEERKRVRKKNSWFWREGTLFGQGPNSPMAFVQYLPAKPPLSTHPANRDRH